ncbi:MAG: putative 2,5-diketo-D-gluconic acid reductase [Microbacteriaceae bacterium]|jgi:2,5-diketo-D-gluconate reductase A|nr:putative 2,5-diketo-D-gluconic acid reductase [Microbacteriaceae bacterium]HEV7955747.1 aldo/keto reductase [Marisediminicola sp.]
MRIGTRTLNDGRSIPILGLGTYGMRGADGVASVVSGIHAGYRLLDTALNYENEREVGKGVRESGVAREEVFVTTKLPGRHHGFDETLASFEESRNNLGLDYLDLYLIHWPLPRVDKFLDSWRAMIRLREQGLARSIGVSNFTPAHIQRLMDETDVAPAVNQVELHPRFPQAALREFHERHGIVTESWSPLGKEKAITAAPLVAGIADTHGRTPTQVVLRWHIQLGAVPIPKSGDPQRQAENLDLFGFELSAPEVAAISSLEAGRLWDGDPDTHEEF